MTGAAQTKGLDVHMAEDGRGGHTNDYPPNLPCSLPSRHLVAFHFLAPLWLVALITRSDLQSGAWSCHHAEDFQHGFPQLGHGIAGLRIPEQSCSLPRSLVNS